MPEIIVRRDGPIGRIIISNPAKYNAMSNAMWAALPPALEQHDADPEVRLVVIEGEGDKAFVSGADISQFETERTGAGRQDKYGDSVEAAYVAPTRCSKPVVAKIRGICFGGGLGLAAACDIRFARADARFRMPAGRLGLGYNAIGVRRFLQVFGVQNTMDIFFSARIFGAEEAARMGFVSKVAAAEDFEKMVDDWCATVAENAPLTLRALKKTVNQLVRDPGDRDMASAEAAIQACFDSDDYREGARAFMEKRPPVFKGA
ncbi:enoyl-CoA hydratase [Burkholderiaceae bacterium FT117]|uniref:enoyl-CoA hydratase n=1 Tax=Zeimonas sediminis TaxID=2944268 RepID=UPI002342D892|nr:enoyl-CoA hydratase [Zeimonas sediminis]MCM5571778.1 enoyl-CoA hydratase [Zeimonas sediminis]